MKKLVFAAASLIVAGLSLAAPAHADWQKRGDEDWRRNDHRMEDSDRRDSDRRGSGRDHRSSDRRGNDGDRDDRRHDGHRGNDHHRDDWRRDQWRHHGWRNDGWRGHPGYGPRVIIRPGHDAEDCFVKKVRYYDAWGNLHIKRIPVCR